jgi:polysaccharide transporter, PST family
MVEDSTALGRSAVTAAPEVEALAPDTELLEPARPKGSLGDAAARGTGITLAVQAGRTIIQFGSIVALARLLTPADFGLVAMVTAVIGVADLVRDFGLSLAAVQTPKLSHGERTNLFWANVGLGLACTLVAMAMTPFIVAGYREPRLAPIVLCLAPVFLFSGITTQFKAGLVRDMRFKAVGLSDFSAQVIATIVAIDLAAAGFGLWALVVQQLVSAAVTAGICFWLAKWRPSWPNRRVSIRRFMRFGVGVFGTQGISYVTKNIDNITIGAVWGASPLGLYSRAYQLMMMPLNQINAPMTQVAMPVLARVQGDNNSFLGYLRKSQLVACYVTATIFAVATGLAEPVVKVLFGNQWLDVVPIFAILAVGGMFRAVAQIAYWAYLAKGKSGALFRQRMVTGLLTVVMILAGLPWGPVGVAVGCTVASFVSWIVAVWHVGRVTGIDTRSLITNAVRIVAVVGIPAGAVAYLGTLVPVIPFLQLVIGGLLVLVYLGLAYLAVPSVREDLNLTLSFGRRAFVARTKKRVAKHRRPEPENEADPASQTAR